MSRNIKDLTPSELKEEILKIKKYLRALLTWTKTIHYTPHTETHPHCKACKNDYNTTEVLAYVTCPLCIEHIENESIKKIG